jgi:hypothetical protein
MLGMPLAQGIRERRKELLERKANRRRHALASAVRVLPLEVRVAMFTALQAEELIVGGYADSRGRVCPTVAATRRGARSYVGSFPEAWDDFGQARRPRVATRREQEVLRAMLEESLTGPVEPWPVLPAEPQPIPAVA